MARNKKQESKVTKAIIGTVTEYIGSDYGFSKNHKVRIIAVLKNAGEGEHEYVGNDKRLQEVGGVTAADRIEVLPWIEKESRYSFASSDPKATELACFKKLTKNAQ